MFTRSEQDHIKAIHTLSADGRAFTKDLAEHLRTKASSVTDMLKRLAEKGLVRHEPYRGARLTARGRSEAMRLVRHHRLWETFLVERLGFGWEEVHEVAEQLEHVSSAKLIDKLDAFLGHPDTDPHGEPIPRRDGAMKEAAFTRLGDLPRGARARVAAVNDRSPEFLRYLTLQRITLGSAVRVTERNEHDGSIGITAGKRTILLGKSSADNILVTR